MDYNRQNNRPRRQINFSSDPAIPREEPPARGLRDEDWDNEEFTNSRAASAARGRESFEDRHYRRESAADMRPADTPHLRTPHQPTAQSSQQQQPRQPFYQQQQQPMQPSYRQPAPEEPEEPEMPKNFVKRHPILMNTLYIGLVAVVLGWVAMLFLDLWTFHGEERVVPDVRNNPLYSASNAVSQAGLHPVVTDSIYDSFARPGTVVEQTPIAGSKVKNDGAVYLTIVAFTPKMVTVPDFYNVSVRQARSLLEGLGIKEVREVQVPSEYAGLVLGARFNGVALRPGARIPVSAVVTLEVGTGLDALAEEGAPIDTAAIEEAVEQIETLDLE